jgi:Phospholipase B
MVPLFKMKDNTSGGLGFNEFPALHESEPATTYQIQPPDHPTLSEGGVMIGPASRKHSILSVAHKSFGKGWRRERGGWIFLHIEGQPRERGVQHGYLLAKEIAMALKAVRFTIKWSTGEDFGTFVRAAKELYADLVDAEIAAELRGIAEGATKAGVPLTYDEVLAWNANIELLWNWWPTMMGKASGVMADRHHHCSAFIATGKGVTRDGGIVLGHNTWDTFINASLYRVILDIAPAHGHRILMQSAPGFVQSGTDFFITGGGLVGAETSIARFSGYDPEGLPEFCRVRRAMQDADNLDQWIATMTTRNNGGYANIWLIGDINTGEIARLELGLKFVGLKRTKRGGGGSFSGCNLPVDPRIRNQECSGVDYSNIMANAGRRIRWEKLLVDYRGRIDREVAKLMLADHYDVMQRKDNPCTRTICGHFDQDPDAFLHGSFGAFEPYGANDAKVTDTAMAKDMSLLARFGRPCGQPFDAKAYLDAHPQYVWQAEFLKDKPKQPWTEFKSGQ